MTSSAVDFDSIAENFKAEWIERQLKQHVNTFSEHIPARIFCGTWNVNGRTVGEDCGLDDWLLPEGEKSSDIYAVGFQEIVDLNPQNVLLDGSLATERSAFWSNAVKRCLEANGSKYAILDVQHLVGILLVVLVREDLLSNVRQVRGAVLSTGVLGMMGNKGGVSIRFNYLDISLCFTSAHLAANRANVQARNSDAADILGRTVFHAPSHSAPSGGKNRKSLLNKTYREITDTATANSDLNILNHHELIFWLGDLNYRIDESVELQEVFDKIEAGQLEFLHERDQLNMERAKKSVFQGFSEGNLQFPPTYKYIPGEDIYEQREGKKKRAPAWCDRVLWSSRPALGVPVRAPVLDTYSCVRSLSASDHKPVFATFSCEIRACVEMKERAFYQDLLRQLDSWENQSIPKVEASGRDIDFGSVLLNEPKDVVVTLRNVGSKPATWHFIAPMDDDGPLCKPCYELRPQMGVVPPGEVRMMIYCKC